jgi:hypothetical protein
MPAPKTVMTASGRVVPNTRGLNFDEKYGDESSPSTYYEPGVPTMVTDANGNDVPNINRLSVDALYGDPSVLAKAALGNGAPPTVMTAEGEAPNVNGLDFDTKYGGDPTKSGNVVAANDTDLSAYLLQLFQRLASK